MSRAIPADTPTKECPLCFQVKSYTLENFPKQNQSKSGLGTYCRPCDRKRKMESDKRVQESDPVAWGQRRKAYQRRYKDKHPDRALSYQRGADFRRKYGITIKQYDEMVEQQGGICLICKAPPENGRLSVDHDHDTGKVRGLLCTKCNVALGMFDENVNRLQQAIIYLETQC